ncbi:MAG: hypothetical protein KGM99_16200 [Burkholderiales bacterium]|nr:hypothetical protein [Burkholderiales bacterium]
MEILRQLCSVRFRSGIVRGALLVMLAGLSCHALAIERVTILLSEQRGAYAEFAEELSNALIPSLSANHKPAIKIINLATLNSSDLAQNNNSQILVAVGTPAMNAMAQKPPAMPVLNVLIPRESYNKTLKNAGHNLDLHRFSAIYVDQPWSRQMALIKVSTPKRSRVGVLASKDFSDQLPSLQTAAKNAGLILHLETVNSDADLLPTLRHLLGNSDVLLAVPDSAVYNRNNIPSILLTSYRQQIPLFGFSAAFVKAGALAAVTSSGAQISKQVAEIINNLQASNGLPAPQYPRYYSVILNSQVSRSLEIVVEDESTLEQKLRLHMERLQ